ncbi:MAG: bacterioferritin-associated ferredoxin [Planctomycetota bacterium]
MYVCLCHAVTDRQLRELVQSGADTADKVGNACGAGTNCGCCRQMIEDMIDKHRPEPINVSAAAASNCSARELRQVS